MEMRLLQRLVITTLLIGCSAAPICALSWLPTDDALLAYWPLDDNFNDYSGHDYHGSSANGASFAAGAGVFGGDAALFDGIDDYVSTSLRYSPLDNDFSISAWVNVDSSAGSNLPVVSCWGRGDEWDTKCWDLRYEGAGPVFRRSNNGSGETSYVGPSITRGEWHHIVALRNGSNLFMYVDNNKYDLGSTDYITDEHHEVSIGRFSHLWDYVFSGMIDEVALFERALSDQEVTNIYTNIPEPVTVLLLGVGGIALRRRRRA